MLVNVMMRNSFMLWYSSFLICAITCNIRSVLVQ